MKHLRELAYTGLLVLWFVAGASAQPQTPAVYLNEKVRLVELARSQRAILRYDLRPIGGEYLTVRLYRHDQNLSGEPARQWVIKGAEGREQLSFKELPLAVYAMVAYCSDEDGTPLATAAPIVHVEYGGWRAWEEFQPPVEEAESQPAGFEDVTVATKISNRDVGIAVSPPAAVIRPGETVEFRAAFRNMEPEPLKWKLVGEGHLKALGEGVYEYTAPQELLGTKLFRVDIQSDAHPDLKGAATILVTNSDLNAIPGGP